MSTISFQIDQLPGLAANAGPFPFSFECSDPHSATATPSIPLVNRGPESYAVSREQEDWVARQWPELEMVFAGAWVAHSIGQIQKILDELGPIAPGPSFAARFLLQQLLSGPKLPGVPTSNGLPAWHARPDVSEIFRVQNLAAHRPPLRTRPRRTTAHPAYKNLVYVARRNAVIALGLPH